MAWYDPTDWDVGDWATVATGPIGWGYSAVSGKGPVGEGIRDGAGALGVGDLFGGDKVSPYDPNFQNFQFSEQALADKGVAAAERQNALSRGVNTMNEAQRTGTALAGDAAALRDQTRQNMLGRSQTQVNRAIGYEAAAGRSQDRGLQIAQPTQRVFDQYGSGGVDAQSGGMRTLADISAGATAGQQASARYAGQLGAMGGQGFSGTPEQQAALGRAVAAQQQTADTSALDATGAQMGALAGGGAVAGQTGAAGRLASMGSTGAIAGQMGGIQRLEDYATQGPGPSAAQAQLLQGQDRAVAGQMALARSGRGGASAAALRQAQANAAGIQQQTSAQSAQLRAQEASAWRDQQLGALGTAQAARGTLGGQQLGALGAAGQGYGQAQASQLAALQGAAQTQAQALGARDAASNRQLQALGIEAQQAQALGGQQLQGRDQQLQALSAAQQASQAQAALQAQAAQGQAGAGATYAGQQLQAAGQAAGLQQSQQQINDAMQLGMLNQAQQANQLGYNYNALGQQGALDYTRLQQQAQQTGINQQLQAQQQVAASGLGYGQLMQGYGTADLNARSNYEQAIGNWAVGAGTANAQADAQRDGAMMGLGGTIGAGVLAAGLLSDRRMKQSVKPASAEPMEALHALAKAPGYEYKYKPEARDRFGAPPGRQWGPMAQDLEKTPAGRTAVQTMPDGTRAIDPGRLATLNASATAALDDRLSRLEQIAGRR